MNPDKLARVLGYLTRPVPPARRPVAEPQASWQQLKPGQRLRSKVPLTLGTTQLPVGLLWTVASVDSLGATLSSVADEISPSPRVSYNLRDPRWRGRLFERVRAPARRKTKVTT